VKALHHPILSASLPGEMVEEYTDPELIYENFRGIADIVIDGGPGGMIPSTVIDCTKEDFEVVRMGAGTGMNNALINRQITFTPPANFSSWSAMA
jgi:tRNA A37 threonylcarbamoyladenosine synthetase subunit TsaC/SUA5/YrdC